jgi:hypothetical protein
VEFGGRNNSYFLGLEKQRQIKKSINELIDENNEKITDQMFIVLEHPFSVTFPSQID